MCKVTNAEARRHVYRRWDWKAQIVDTIVNSNTRSGRKHMSVHMSIHMSIHMSTHMSVHMQPIVEASIAGLGKRIHPWVSAGHDVHLSSRQWPDMIWGTTGHVWTTC